MITSSIKYQFILEVAIAKLLKFSKLSRIYFVIKAVMSDGIHFKYKSLRIWGDNVSLSSLASKYKAWENIHLCKLSPEKVPWATVNEQKGRKRTIKAHPRQWIHPVCFVLCRYDHFYKGMPNAHSAPSKIIPSQKHSHIKRQILFWIAFIIITSNMNLNRKNSLDCTYIVRIFPQNRHFISNVIH